MSKRKIISSTLSILPLTSLSILYDTDINELEFDKSQQFSIVKTPKDTTPGIFNTIQKLFPDNLFVNYNYNPY
ncbi:UNVERIFIED_CONTAM: hypothetical protein O8I53_11490 [Campylobacter lari]